MKPVLFLLFIIFSIFILLLIRDVPRHGGILPAINSWTMRPLFDLRHSENCYELRNSNSGLLLVMKNSIAPDPDYDTESGIPDGSVMKVEKTLFDPQPHLGICRHYRGYFITRDGEVEWILTQVKTP